jgi:hypothetical protein
LFTHTPAGDLGMIHDPVASLAERIERSRHVVAIDAEGEQTTITRQTIRRYASVMPAVTSRRRLARCAGSLSVTTRRLPAFAPATTHTRELRSCRSAAEL